MKWLASAQTNFGPGHVSTDGAAAETGRIKKGDVINKCDGFELTAMTLKELVAHIKGAPGTSLVLVSCGWKWDSDDNGVRLGALVPG